MTRQAIPAIDTASAAFSDDIKQIRVSIAAVGGKAPPPDEIDMKSQKTGKVVRFTRTGGVDKIEHPDDPHGWRELAWRYRSPDLPGWQLVVEGEDDC